MANDFVLATKRLLADVTRNDQEVDETYGCPLYGFDPSERLGKACCDWGTFISSFAHHYHAKAGAWPFPGAVKDARAMWRRYSMSGYEAFATVTRRAVSA